MGSTTACSKAEAAEAHAVWRLDSSSEQSKNVGMDAQLAPMQLSAQCLLPGCRRAGLVAVGQFTETELRLPYEALGAKLRCSCGSRQVRVAPWSMASETAELSPFQRWYA